jgi:hypothetical protein
MMLGALKVFLSYHSKDSAAAEGLTKALEAAGLEVVDPIRGLDPGGNLFEQAAKALEASQAMVFVVSPDAVESTWAKKQLEYALTQPRFEGRVVPVLARPTKDVPWILNKLVMLDLKSGPTQVGRKASELIKRTPSERRKQLGA